MTTFSVKVVIFFMNCNELCQHTSFHIILESQIAQLWPQVPSFLFNWEYENQVGLVWFGLSGLANGNGQADFVWHHHSLSWNKV